MYEIKYSKEKAPDGTGYNDTPKGWKEIDKYEFATYFFTYSPSYIEHRQIIPKDKDGKRLNKTPRSTILYWMYDNTGFAISQIYSRKKNKFFMRYYRFGCSHEWGAPLTDEQKKTVPRGRCISAYKCKKCGHFEWVDSSD
jgi:hypothetical protein